MRLEQFLFEIALAAIARNAAARQAGVGETWIKIIRWSERLNIKMLLIPLAFSSSLQWTLTAT